MTRHKDKPVDYDKMFAWIDERERWEGLPENQMAVAESKRRVAEFMATLDCECTWDCCEGNDTLRYCQSDTIFAQFIHKWNCKEAKPWMDNMPCSKDGFELRYGHGLIETNWEAGPADGLGAMVGAWSCAKAAANLGCTMGETDLMQEIARYNHVDCRVMMEILRHLRKHH